MVERVFGPFDRRLMRREVRSGSLVQHGDPFRIASVVPADTLSTTLGDVVFVHGSPPGGR